MKLFFFDLKEKLSDWWFRIKDWVVDHKMIAIMILLTFILVVWSIVSGVNYQRYQKTEQAQQRITQKQKTDPYNILGDGPKKYLIEQLGVKNEAQVKKLFDNNVKYKGRYDEVISQGAQINNVDEFHKYMNPIVDEIKNGQTVQQQQTGLQFATQAPSSDDLINGVVLLLIDSSKPDQVKQATDYKNAQHNFSVKVYDSTTKGGKSLFTNTVANYLMPGDGYRPGYSEDDINEIGQLKAYGFYGNEYTFKSDSLSSLPGKDLSRNPLKQ